MRLALIVGSEGVTLTSFVLTTLYLSPLDFPAGSQQAFERANVNMA